MEYNKRLQNTQARRSDVQFSNLTESYVLPSNKIGDSMKYAFENMMPIDVKYNTNTIVAAEKVKKHLEQEFTSKNISAVFEYQGSVLTNTNIKLHSDIDLLTITNKFYISGNGVPEKHLYLGDSLADLKELNDACQRKVSAIYSDVKLDKGKCISVNLSNPSRKVDIVVANKYVYKEEFANDLKHCGIQIYDHNLQQRLPQDYPFHHLRKVKYKVMLTNDKFAQAVRLLKTLKADSDTKIDLSSFELTCFAYSISDLEYNRCTDKLQILSLLRSSLNAFIIDKNLRDQVESPNTCEKPFKDFSRVHQFVKMKAELDELIKDIINETNLVINKIKALNYEKY